MCSEKKQILLQEIITVLVFLCLVVGTSVVSIEGSDWLITKGNRKIEVQSYYIDGAMVIMRLQNGKLAQIAYEDIDWDKTKELNQAGRTLTEINTIKNTSHQQEEVTKPYQSLREKKRYTGAPISLELKDADIRDVLRFFAEFAGLNFVIDPEVAGKTTILLKEVPWDQALETILRNSGLGMVTEGNVYRIASVQKLINEEAARRNLAEQQSLSSPMVTIVRRLSYANASDMANIIKKFLSPRGSIMVDERTNSMIITDIAEIISEIESHLEIKRPEYRR